MEHTKSFDTILAENFDFEGLSITEKKQAEEKMKELLIENSLIRVMEEISEEETLAFEKFLAEDKKTEEIIFYLENNIPIFNKILFEEVELLIKST